MPRFLDHHPLPEMTPEQTKAMVAQLKTAIDSKKPDKFGVTVLNVFLAKGESWGYTDAPSAEAVVKNHEALGVKVSVKEITQVTPII